MRGTHDVELRAYAVTSLGLLNDARAADALTESIEDREPRVGLAALEALKPFSSIAVYQRIVQCFDGSENENVKIKALEALEAMEPRDRDDRCVKPLSRSLARQANPRLLELCIEVLASLGTNAAIRALQGVYDSGRFSKRGEMERLQTIQQKLAEAIARSGRSVCV